MNSLPIHIAIIMDGNGRWAKQKGLLRVLGHENGIGTVRRITEACAKKGIQYLTLYTFSTENWNRPAFEVNALMEILVRSLQKEIDTLKKNQVRLLTIGDSTALPEKTQQALRNAVAETVTNKGLTLVLALSYGGRWDLLQATQKIEQLVKNNELEAEAITEQTISQYLTTATIPNPDLVIRTGGEMRLSNFLTWESAYSELYFTETYWPDFSEIELDQAIANFGNRERRFGKTGEQIRGEE